MINIRPVSDLRNKYPEIEELVLNKDEEVYLTKNGYGTMVVMSLEKYSKLTKQSEIEKNMQERFGEIDMENLIIEMEKEIDDPNTKFLTHEEVFSKARRILDGEI